MKGFVATIKQFVATIKQFVATIKRLSTIWNNVDAICNDLNDLKICEMIFETIPKQFVHSTPS